MKEIFLIRHGRQCSKLCNVDVELDEAGRKQAALVGERLKTYGLEKLYSSELIRARETAEIIGKKIGLSCEVLPDIQEIHFGGFTGKTDEAIREQYADFRRERSLHQADLPYPEGGECGADVVRRVMPQLHKLCQRPEMRIGVVTHGGVIRSTCAAVLQTEQRHKLKFAMDMENTSLTHLIYDEDRGFFILERFNDFAHLEGHPELLRGNWKTSLERNG
ncbi:MAG: histidine phosphatase family protein [Lachnospiraceae bacterium]|nr:histidine phosphatase family protein [Lachnospiraceae bacterium]